MIPFDRSVEVAIRAWLHEKRGRTNSVGTEQAYAAGLASFRQVLQSVGHDVDASIDILAPALQAWAARGTRQETVSAATFNRQVALVSSFYEYCIRQNLLGITTNPSQRVKRRPVTAFQKALPVKFINLSAALGSIERVTTRGKRDFALILVAALSGRRLSELAALNWEDIEFDDEGVRVTWQRTKGGKTLRDRLPMTVANVLKDYRAACASTACSAIVPHQTTGGTSPVWLALTPNGKGRLSTKGLERICLRRIGTSKFHTLRHSFAHEMERQGASVSEIQRRLGHSNIATTGKYLEQMRMEDNAFMDSLARQLGLS